jgi:signal transduction histidine kinase
MRTATTRQKPAAPMEVRVSPSTLRRWASPRGKGRQTDPLAWNDAAATIAHELKNLLGATELYASIIEEAVREHPDLSLLASRLLTGLRSLSAVATNLLSLGRRSEPLLSVVDLHRVLGEAADFAGHAVRGTGVELVTDFAAPPALIRGDAEQLKQVFLNLVLNALQAMPNGGILTIHTSVKTGQLRVTIADTGTGIPAELLPRIFDPFVTTKPKGTGLGLFVVAEILSRHSATIEVSSAAGQGTQVRCNFRLAAEHDARGGPNR